MSMDSSGKVTWAGQLQLPVKDMGSCDVYPQTAQHSPNGR